MKGRNISFVLISKYRSKINISSFKKNRKIKFNYIIQYNFVNRKISF